VLPHIQNVRCDKTVLSSMLPWLYKRNASLKGASFVAMKA